jgi:hypothetical protein
MQSFIDRTIGSSKIDGNMEIDSAATKDILHEVNFWLDGKFQNLGRTQISQAIFKLIQGEGLRTNKLISILLSLHDI